MAKKEAQEIMGISHFPKEILDAIDIYEPYLDSHNGSIEGAPKEVVEAYEKSKKWAWEQGQ